MMRLGPLDRRIRIEQKSVTQDASYGTEVITWVTFAAVVHANIQEVLPSKGESQADGIRIAERPARVRTRYLGGVTSDMRIVYLDRGNRVMKIATQPVELGRKQGLEFVASDFSTQGDGA